MAWAADVYETARQPDFRDILVGVDTISELDDTALGHFVSVSFQRYQCLQLLLNLQGDLANWQDWQEFCFPCSPQRVDIEQTVESIIL